MTKTYQLDASKIKDVEDIKKILDVLQIRIQTDNPIFEELQNFFTIQVVPPGYLKVYEKVGPDEIHNMSMEEIAQMGLELLQNEQTN